MPLTMAGRCAHCRRWATVGPVWSVAAGSVVLVLGTLALSRSWGWIVGVGPWLALALAACFALRVTAYRALRRASRLGVDWGGGAQLIRPSIALAAPFVAAGLGVALLDPEVFLRPASRAAVGPICVRVSDPELPSRLGAWLDTEELGGAGTELIYLTSLC